MLKIVVIVVTYNNQATIERCLQSVFKNATPSFDLSLIIIDNNSQDRTVAVAKECIPLLSATADNRNKSGSLPATDCRLQTNQTNLGFARAVNQGIKLAQKKFAPDYFFLLNPDAYLEKDCLKNLLNTDNPNSSLISPLILEPENEQLWFSGGKINWFKMRTEHLENDRSTLLQSKHQKLATDYLTGCALLIPQAVIQRIGLFDENFFLYYEDADFSLRAQKAGFPLKIVPLAVCYHQESHSFQSNPISNPIFSSKSNTKNLLTAQGKPDTQPKQSTSRPKNKDYHLVKSGLTFFQKHFPQWAKPYFRLKTYSRLSYHKFITGKQNISHAIEDFLKNS